MEQKDLQVKYTDPLDLIPYENNPRINDYAVKKVMESIKEYGFTNPDHRRCRYGYHRRAYEERG